MCVANMDLALQKFTIYFAGAITAPSQAFSEVTNDAIKSTCIYVCKYGLCIAEVHLPQSDTVYQTYTANT